MKTAFHVGLGLFLAVAVLALGSPSRLAAADDHGPDPKELKALVDKGIAHLRKTQKDDGSWGEKRFNPGATALISAALLRNGLSADDPLLAKSIAYLEKKVHDDGGIYDKRLANYTTSVALMTFVEANTNHKYDTVISNATKYLKGLQYADDQKDVKFGGVGYDAKSRPDVSNTQFFLDSLMAAGVSKDDPAVQRAVKFLSRCQNLPGETNDQPFAKKTTPDDKGGFTYIPDPDDKEHKTADGGLRSLGAMTYAGLKSFLYAGVAKDDPRVKAAIAWIRAHYTLEDNPGEGQNGLYYYYHTFAKAMTALGEEPFVDSSGKKHDWRKELFAALKERQNEDGSWVNNKDRAFGEKDKDLTTGFALLTLSYCKPAKK
jgi:squalene-hopene/tetraprenyl-beta-curcumene cyclase